MGTKNTSDPKPPEDAGPHKSKPGRPKGSIKKISDEHRGLVLSAVENGGTDHTAAKACEVDPKTFKRWRAIAEGDEDHPQKEYLVQLFLEIDAAAARCRLRREIEVANRYPKDWLKNQAPSEPGLPGWTPRVADPADDAQATALYIPTPEEQSETIRILISSGAVPDPFAKERNDVEEDEVQDPGD